MNVLRLLAYYQPEQTAGIHLISELSEGLTAAGMRVITYTPDPTRGIPAEIRQEYKKRREETLHEGREIVHRFPMFSEGSNPIQRALRYLMCNVKEYRLGTREKDIDLVYSSSTPPTQGFLSGMAAGKLSRKQGHRVPFVYNLQDIFPDSLANTGMTRKGSLLWKIGRSIENATYRRADRIIVISEGFRRNLLAKGVPDGKIAVVSNWVDLDQVKPVPREENRLFQELGIDEDTFVVVYAGNIGEAQGAEVILDAARLLEDEKQIRFVIFGGGPRFEALQERVRSEGFSNLTITGLMPLERVSEVYSMGDAALITCRKGTGGAGMPSKTWSILACGTPIIASFDTESDLADVLKASGAGCCVDPENPQSLADAIREAFRTRPKTAAAMESLRAYAMRTASREACVGEYIRQFREVLQEARE